MAVGLPVISTLHGGIPKLMESGVSGFLVAERNTDEIEERLLFLMIHPERWPKMGRAGRKKVEDYFEINKLNDSLLKIYQQLRRP